MELIEGGGKYASVEDVVHEHNIIVNPLVPVDYHNDFGVEAIPETEDVSDAFQSYHHCHGRCTLDSSALGVFTC